MKIQLKNFKSALCLKKFLFHYKLNWIIVFIILSLKVTAQSDSMNYNRLTFSNFVDTVLCDVHESVSNDLRTIDTRIKTNKFNFKNFKYTKCAPQDCDSILSQYYNVILSNEKITRVQFFDKNELSYELDVLVLNDGYKIMYQKEFSEIKGFIVQDSKRDMLYFIGMRQSHNLMQSDFKTNQHNFHSSGIYKLNLLDEDLNLISRFNIGNKRANSKTTYKGDERVHYIYDMSTCNESLMDLDSVSLGSIDILFQFDFEICKYSTVYKEHCKEQSNWFNYDYVDL